MKKKILISGIEFIIFEKSIKVDGIVSVFFFNREVSIEDAQQLAHLIVIGRNQLKTDLRNLLCLE